MERAEEADEDGPLPERQVWQAARQRLIVTGVAVAALGSVLVAILWFRTDGLALALRLAWLVLLLGMAARGGWLAWRLTTARVEADREGLRVVNSPGTTTYPWQDISKIRPSILKGRRTNLVLVRHGGRTVDLPITTEHLGELERWHRTFT